MFSARRRLERGWGVVGAKLRTRRGRPFRSAPRVRRCRGRRDARGAGGEVKAPRVALRCHPPFARFAWGGVPAAHGGSALPLPPFSSQPARGFAVTGLPGVGEGGVGARPLRPLGPVGVGVGARPLRSCGGTRWRFRGQHPVSCWGGCCPAGASPNGKWRGSVASPFKMCS